MDTSTLTYLFTYLLLTRLPTPVNIILVLYILQ